MGTFAAGDMMPVILFFIFMPVALVFLWRPNDVTNALVNSHFITESFNSTCNMISSLFATLFQK